MVTISKIFDKFLIFIEKAQNICINEIFNLQII